MDTRFRALRLDNRDNRGGMTAAVGGSCRLVHRHCLSWAQFWTKAVPSKDFGRPTRKSLYSQVLTLYH
jgi:hypothetical protein